MTAEASSSAEPRKSSKSKKSKTRADAEVSPPADGEEEVSKNKRHRKDKRELADIVRPETPLTEILAWDTDEIDQSVLRYLRRFIAYPSSWKIDPFPAPTTSTPLNPFLDESSFALLFPKYREPYLRSIWSSITSALERVGLACELDLVQGKMTVRTTRKTWDPYIVFKGRDLLKLLARGVGVPQVGRSHPVIVVAVPRILVRCPIDLLIVLVVSACMERISDDCFVGFEDSAR